MTARYDAGRVAPERVKALQAQFREDFLAAGTGHRALLIAPVGAGKTFLTRQIVAQLVKADAGKALVLVPTRAVQDAYVHQLHRAEPQLRVVGVDGKAFRALRSQAPTDRSLWPEPVAVVLGVDFAKRPDVAATLADTVWDLVVIDEAHRLRGERAALAERLVSEGAASRLLLLSSVEPDFEEFSVPGLVTTRWSFGPEEPPAVVVDWRVVDYTRGPDEVAFVERLLNFLPAMTEASEAGRFRAGMMERRAASSLAAVERSLIRFMNDLRGSDEEASGPAISAQEQEDWTAVLDDGEPVDPQRTLGLQELSDPESAMRPLATLLDALDEIGAEAKADALVNLIAQRVDRPRNMWIFTSFADTARYLAVVLEDAGIPSRLLMGAQSLEERQEEVASTPSEAVVVATEAAATGIELPTAREIVHYDLGPSGDTTQKRLALFDLFSVERVTNVAFRDTSGVFPSEGEVLRKSGFDA